MDEQTVATATWRDVLGLDPFSGPGYSEAELARVDLLRSIADSRDYDAEGQARTVLAELVDAGLLVDLVPAAWGGRDGSVALAARLVEAAATADGSLGWLLTTQYGLHLMLPTLTNGDCERYFTDIVDRGVLISGSHSRHSLKATMDGADAIVSGILRYCSGAPVAGWITTTAEIPVGATKRGCTLMINSKAAGIRCEPAPHLHGMRGSLTGFVHLDRVRVPRADIHLFRDLTDPTNRTAPGRYFGVWQALLLQNAVFLGIAANALRTAAPVLRRRAERDDARGSAVSTAAYGAAAADLLVARSLLHHRIRCLEAANEDGLAQDRSDLAGHPVLLGVVANRAYTVVSRLMEQLGGSVLIDGHPLERCWRDIQLARAAEGSKWDAVQVELGAALLDGSTPVAGAQTGVPAPV